jgi:N-acetylneuraminic acid mutarotase
MVLLACVCLPADAQTGEWTWMGGSSTLGAGGAQPGVYGTLLTPAGGNTPGGRDGAANWTGSNGHLWLLGGYGYDVNGDSGYLNDLWEFNPATSQWTWMSGSDTVGGHGGQPGAYGTLGQPAAGNTPGSRDGAATWTDGDGNLWLFGGWDYDIDSIAGELNDLWKFNPATNQWTWMGGSSNVGPNDGQSGVYGTLGTPAAGNTPGGIVGAASWTDSSGNFLLFGGQGYDASGNFHELNGLWEFNPATRQWTWMGGSKTVDSTGEVPGVYGTLGAPAGGNIPGNRSGASNWTAGGSSWLLGGNGYDADGSGGYLNDLWEFDSASNEWTWMAGSSTVGPNGAQPGVYGTLEALTTGNAPGGRWNAASWTDAAGNLWLLGGYGADSAGNVGYLSDLWEFDPAAGEWAWMSGSSTVPSNGGQSGIYGTLGTPAAQNAPGGRDAANGWTDSSGKLWLFGGYGYDAGGNYGHLNDLWRFEPSTASESAATPVFSPGAGSYASAQSVTISDLTAGATIYYTANGTTPTTSSAVYVGAITVASTETLQAVAVATGVAMSAVAAATYTIGLPQAEAPAFSPVAGSYASAQSVTISDLTAGATIYYTANGTTPTTSSAVYVGAITVASTETLQAIAVASGYSTSAVAAAAYIIGGAPTAAAPTFSPTAGNYASAQTVTISDLTAGATIYYTANGTTPTTSSAVYVGAITVASTETLQAIAVASGVATSAVAAAAYVIGLQSAAATPTFSPAAGSYASAQSVTISDSTAGATIYYTANGTTPTTSSAVYVGAITVASTETLKAIAVASGYSTSAVATATYTIGGTAPSFIIGGTAITVVPGATAGNTSTITITPSGGFTGAVGLTVAVTASPAGAQDMPVSSFGSTSPIEITGSGAGTATLTVSTIAASSGTLTYPARPGGRGVIPAATALACLLLFGVPARRRWRTTLGLAALFATLAIGVTACGSTITRNTISGDAGTTPGTYTLTVTGISGATAQSSTIELTVQ